MKIQKPRGHFALFITIVIVFLLTISLVWFISGQLKERSATRQSQTDTNSPAEAQQPEPTDQITLPGAEPIRKMDGDYTSDDHLWRLVNKTNPLTDTNYRPTQLTLFAEQSRADKSNDERSVRADIAPFVEQLLTDAKTAGFDMIIGSGFRSYELQNAYYTSYSNTHGQEAADTFSAKPGYSEHQTGLVVDLSTRDQVCYLQACFGETAAGIWLAENAHSYGFILRYPKDKQDITGYIYEPWHFRYVGKDLAGALRQSSLTLDQAWPYLTEEG